MPRHAWVSVIDAAAPAVEGFGPWVILVCQGQELEKPTPPAGGVSGPAEALPCPDIVAHGRD